MKFWQAVVAAALFWAAVFLPGLGTQELKGEEGRRVLPARTMLQTGEWTVPFVGGKPYSRKPPLINWLVAGSFKVAGEQNEWTARLPTVLAVGLMGLALVWWGLRSGFGSGAGYMAAVFAMGNVALLEKGRLIEIEGLYVGLTAAAFATWSAFWLGRGSRWLVYTVPWIFLGLAMLAKGPVHLIFFYGPVVATLWFSRKMSELIKLPHLCGLGVMLGLFLPWASINRARVAELAPKEESAQSVWLNEILMRFNLDGFSPGEWLLTPIEIAANFLPWVLVLIPLWWWGRKRGWTFSGGSTAESYWMRGTSLGILISVLPVALVPGTMARYVHPVIGAVAMLLAALLVRSGGEGGVPERVRRWWGEGNLWGARGVVFLGAAMLTSVVVLDVRGSELLHRRSAGPLIGCLSALAFGAIAWRSSRRLRIAGSDERLAGASALICAGVLMMYSMVITPASTVRDNVRPTGLAIQSDLPEGAHLCVLKPQIQPFLFYLDPGYEVVDRGSRIPSSTSHLLGREDVVAKMEGSGNFGQFGFTEFSRYKDKEGKWWLLMRAVESLP